MLAKLNIPKAEAFKLYLLITALQSFALSLVFTVNLFYQVKQVGLNPLQLVLIGTTLEATAFLMEIPTGVVADVYSRRLSVILGFMLLGLGFIMEGSLPLFEALAAAQVIAGVGYTFLSGAASAWIVDEIGQARASAAFLRASQASQIAGFVGIFVSVALASISLQLAIVAGGLLLAALAVALMLFMPEDGFTRQAASEGESWAAFFVTFRAGLKLALARRMLILIMLATVIHGAFSEGFDRLWTAHLVGQFTLPALGQLHEIVWFGIISAASAPLSLMATEVIRRRVDLSSGRAVLRTLTAVYGLMIFSALLFALGGRFEWALAGLWMTGALRTIRNPLMETWVNQNTESKVRATVLSMQGQADAFGQIAGGPAVGAVALLRSVRFAMALSALMLTPILAVFHRSLKDNAQDD